MGDLNDTKTKRNNSRKSSLKPRFHLSVQNVITYPESVTFVVILAQIIEAFLHMFESKKSLQHL